MKQFFPVNITIQFSWFRRHGLRNVLSMLITGSIPHTVSGRSPARFPQTAPIVHTRSCEISGTSRKRQLQVVRYCLTKSTPGLPSTNRITKRDGNRIVRMADSHGRGSGIISPDYTWEKIPRPGYFLYHVISDHFVGVNISIPLPKGGERLYAGRHGGKFPGYF